MRINGLLGLIHLAARRSVPAPGILIAPKSHATSGVNRSRRLRVGNATRAAPRNNRVVLLPARRLSSERPDINAARRARSKKVFRLEMRNRISQKPQRTR